MSAPRVLHIVQSGDRGGVQRHVRDLAIGLAPLTAGVVTGSGGWLVDVLDRAGIPGVFVVDAQGIAHYRMVRAGQSVPGGVEILAGLGAGETVVVGNLSAVNNGDRIASSRLVHG